MNGQLGNRSTTKSVIPVQVQGLTAGVSEIAAGGYGHTCAIVSGTVECWGYNVAGQLGNNSTTTSTVPVQAQGLTAGVTMLTAGNTNTCALVDGIAQCWGGAVFGQLGNNSYTDSLLPVNVLFQ